MTLSTQTKLSILPGTSAAERSYIDFFRERTMKQLLGDFASVEFDSLLVQIISAEPIVRHAVFALSSAQRMQLAQEQSPKDVCFALQHYGKAMRGLTEGLSDNPDPTRSNVSMMTCVLLICFEYIRQRYDESVVHFQGGLTMVKTSTIDDCLIEIFERLDLMQCLMTATKPCLTFRVPHKRDSQQDRQPFRTIPEARDALLSWTTAVINLNIDIDAQLSKLNEAPGIPEDLLFQLESQQSALQEASRTWFESLDGMVTDHSSIGVSDQRTQLEAIGTLRIRGLTLNIMLKTALSGSQENLMDIYIPDFRQIITLAESRVQNKASESSHLSSCSANAFSLELGIIAPLYWAASKCRDPALRRKAIAILLSTQHREGPWQAQQFAMWAWKVVRWEEKTAMMLRNGRPVTCASDVPEAARLQHAFFDTEKPDMMYYKKRLFGANGEWVFHEDDKN